MTPTMEEVAGWLREAADLSVSPTLNFTKRDIFVRRAAQVEAMGAQKTCDTCASYGEYWEQVTNYNRSTNTCLDGYVHGKGPKFGCIHHKQSPQPPVKK